MLCGITPIESNHCTVLENILSVCIVIWQRPFLEEIINMADTEYQFCGTYKDWKYKIMLEDGKFIYNVDVVYQ